MILNVDECNCAVSPPQSHSTSQLLPQAALKPVRVTLRDLANKVGVSHTTISRALRNDPEISQPLRERIQRVAKELGYRPDPMLSALAQYRRKAGTPVSAGLAWFNHWPNPKQLRSYREFDLYWKGAFAEAERCGFRLEEFSFRDGNLDRLEGILRARNIKGILLPPHGDFALDYRRFKWNDFCTVRFGHSITYPHAHLVSSDQLTDGIIAYENIFMRGYRRIGLVTSARERTRFGAGFLFGQMKWNPEFQLPSLVLGAKAGDVGADKTLLKAWLKANKPDAILSDIAELPGLLSQLGWEIPGDVGLAAFSVLDGNADSGINQNSYEIGRAAVQLLNSLIYHNEFGIPEICRELLVEGFWVDGATLPQRPNRKSETVKVE